MKTIACIALGLVAGYFINFTYIFMPDDYAEFIGSAVVRNEQLQELSGFISTENSTSRPILWWIMSFSISFPPLILLAMTATFIVKQIGNPRAFIYSTLIFPISTSAWSIYSANLIYEFNANYGDLSIQFAYEQIILYAFHTITFIVFFYLLGLLTKKHIWRRA